MAQPITRFERWAVCVDLKTNGKIQFVDSAGAYRLVPQWDRKKDHRLNSRDPKLHRQQIIDTRESSVTITPAHGITFTQKHVCFTV